MHTSESLPLNSSAVKAFCHLKLLGKFCSGDVRPPAFQQTPPCNFNCAYTVPACSPRRGVAAGTALQLLSRALAGGINFGLLGKTENGQKCIWGQSQCFPQPENKYFTPSFIFHVSVFLPSFCFTDLDKVDKFGLRTFF